MLILLTWFYVVAFFYFFDANNDSPNDEKRCWKKETVNRRKVNRMLRISEFEMGDVRDFKPSDYWVNKCATEKRSWNQNVILDNCWSDPVCLIIGYPPARWLYAVGRSSCTTYSNHQIEYCMRWKYNRWRHRVPTPDWM